MEFSDIARLLNPAPMPLEMGYERLENGVLHIAARTDMHKCTGAMFKWWFGSRPNTQWYSWWHPVDHISSGWIEGVPGIIPGAIHQVEEKFTDMPAETLFIQFREPSEMFGADAISSAETERRISAIVCGHGSEGRDPKRKPDGTVVGSRMVHVCRDTEWGMVLRSHFFLGHDLPGVGVPLSAMHDIFRDGMGPGLMQHCYDEFTFLSRFLPSLYIAENRGNGHGKAALVIREVVQLDLCLIQLAAHIALN